MAVAVAIAIPVFVFCDQEVRRAGRIRRRRRVRLHLPGSCLRSGWDGIPGLARGVILFPLILSPSIGRSGWFVVMYSEGKKRHESLHPRSRVKLSAGRQAAPAE